MGTDEVAGVFARILESRASRALLMLLASRPASAIERALEVAVGVRPPESLSERVTASLLTRVVSAGARSFGADPSEVLARMRDPYWRRALVSVLRGLAYFGLRKPFVPGAPFLVVWDVTYACNLRCRHCYANAGRPLPGELTTEEALEAVDKLADAGVVAIAWSGGEPLVRPDIYELSARARDRGMFVAVATNGTLLDEETADRLWESGVRFVQVSLDGASPETHDEFRGVPGAWERAVRGIRAAVRRGFFVNVSVTVTKRNLGEIPRLVDLAEELGAHWLMAFNFVPTGRGELMSDEDITPEEREELLRYFYSEMKRGRKIQLLSTAPQFARVAIQMSSEGELLFPTHFYDAELSGRLRSLAEFIGGCGAGRFYVAMTPDGWLKPCVFIPVRLANIRELEDFSEWWRTDPTLEALRDKDSLAEPCGSCRYRYVCGGCRARAYGYLGDLRAPDPGCVLASRLLEVTA